MPPSPEVLIATPQALRECCAHLAAAPVLGFDTEFIGERSYHPHLCLIQAATEERIFLIDPLALSDLEPFWRILANPAHTIVVHAGREEVRLCHLWSGQTPANLFDLQIAAGLTGLPYPMGHGPLVAEVLGERLSKGETLTDWRARPLTQAQLSYACDDVRHLPALWRRLMARLEKLQRMAWAHEEFDRLKTWATPDEEGLNVAVEKWRKIKGAGALSRRGLALLRELFDWRERLAAQVNRPPRTLVRDDLLLEVARKHPKTPHDLHVIRGLARRYADDIFDALRRGRAVPAEECPSAADRTDDPLQVTLVAPILQAVLAQIASRLQVAPNLAAAAADLKMLVRRRLRGLPPDPASLLTQGWRAAHVLPELLAVLDGQKTLRIAQLNQDVPFIIEDSGERRDVGPPVSQPEPAG